MRKQTLLDKKALKMLLPLVVTVLGSVTPIIIGLIPSTNAPDGEIVTPGFNTPDVEHDTNNMTRPPMVAESIKLDPDYLTQVISNTSHDFKMEDMTYVYLPSTRTWYLVMAGYQWQGSTVGTNTTWRMVWYVVNVVGSVYSLSYSGMNSPGTTEDGYKYNSSFSSIAAADINEDGIPELICGGKITYSSTVEKAFIRVCSVAPTGALL
ncbi:MAG: hypothetical protein GYA24_20150, partial [Candidatus Lokiarchaeota archaeon]|nr:hypothetical protein [Candidatus Lokiarchaeota archaeon]